MPDPAVNVAPCYSIFLNSPVEDTLLSCFIDEDSEAWIVE